jgi:hypothetical protein
MPRPPFTPNDDQRRILQALGELAARRAVDDAELTRLIVQADEQNIPVAAIAEGAAVERKTIYRRLGRPMR